jgi:VIT1/CCC1 family predicted Fe2+/Mn2+ transporter
MTPTPTQHKVTARTRVLSAVVLAASLGSLAVLVALALGAGVPILPAVLAALDVSATAAVLMSAGGAR